MAPANEPYGRVPVRIDGQLADALTLGLPAPADLSRALLVRMRGPGRMDWNAKLTFAERKIERVCLHGGVRAEPVTVQAKTHWGDHATVLELDGPLAGSLEVEVNGRAAVALSGHRRAAIGHYLGVARQFRGTPFGAHALLEAAGTYTADCMVQPLGRDAWDNAIKLYQRVVTLWQLGTRLRKLGGKARCEARDRLGLLHRTALRFRRTRLRSQPRPRSSASRRRRLRRRLCTAAATGCALSRRRSGCVRQTSAYV